MERRIAQFSPHACQQRLNLDPVPAKYPRKQRIAIGWHGFDHVDLMVTAELLKFGVFGPGTLRELLPLAFSAHGVGHRHEPCKRPLER